MFIYVAPALVPCSINGLVIDGWYNKLSSLPISSDVNPAITAYGTSCRQRRRTTDSADACVRVSQSSCVVAVAAAAEVFFIFFGFALGYCNAGGKITNRQWVPLGTKDFASIIAALPDDVDALYIGLGGADAVNFLNQYKQAGGGDVGIIGGTIMVDGTVLSSKGDAKKLLVGTPSAGPQADTWDDAKWQAYVKAYQDAFPPEKRFPSPSLLATGYYNATNAMVSCLNTVNGDLSDGHAKFRQCLAGLELDAPNGKIKLDGNRQAIGSNFVTEVAEQPDGNLANQFVSKIDNVNQTLGMDEAKFRELGIPSRDSIKCD